MTAINDRQRNATEEGVESHLERTTFTFRGTIVEAFGSTLVMINKAGWEHTLTLTPYAHVTCDGATCSLKDLKVGEKIRVTTMKSDRSVATDVDAFDKHREFTQHD